MDKSDLKDCRLWEVNGLQSLRTFLYGSGAFEYRSYTQLGAIVQLGAMAQEVGIVISVVS